MHWDDEAILLTARPHGESGLVATALTRTRGRRAGLVRGGQGRRLRGVYQPGNLLSLEWSGRLPEHLGSFTADLLVSHAASVLDQPDALLALSASTAISDAVLPEHEPHAACFDGLLALLAALDSEHWAEVYVRWEVALLSELGFGLDLTACAGGGDGNDLIYVSPRSGRAVSREAGEPFKEKLLALPGFLVGRGGGGTREVADGLRLTGFFFNRFIFEPQDRGLPESRERLMSRYTRAAEEQVSGKDHDEQSIQ